MLSDRRNIRFQNKIDRVLKSDELRRNPRTGEAGHRGDSNERRALKLAKQIVANEALFKLHPKREIKITRPFSIMDRAGYDLIFPTEKGEFGIQVKSSRKAARNFAKKHPKIPCIIINERRSDEQIIDELRISISYAYAKL